MNSDIMFFMQNQTKVSTTNTWDPSAKNSNVTLSGGNLTTSTPALSVYMSVLGLSSFSHSSGKYYFEITITTSTSNSMTLGVGTSAVSLSDYAGQQATSWGIYQNTGGYYNNGTLGSSGVSFAPGDIISVAVDISAGKIWFAKNGTWMSSGNPATGANPAMTGVTGTLMPLLSNYNSCTNTTNFGATPYTYTPPTGFGNW